MKRSVLYSVFTTCLLLFHSPAQAQFVEIGMDQLQRLMTEGKKATLVDVRSLEEYRTAHIPGAINIPAERIMAERGRLPKDRSAPLIFYCRGVG
ncbi:MAG: rhodanese-like domain-containing protein [Nitrospirota bacterium]